MLTIKSEFRGMESTKVIKYSYTVGALHRRCFRRILDQHFDVVEYRESKGLVSSDFHVIAPVWFLREIEVRLVNLNSEERVVKTRKKNISDVMDTLEHYALEIYLDSKGDIQVTFPHDSYVEEFEKAMKEYKIRVKVKLA